MADRILLRGGVTTSDPRLGRVPEFDEKSRQFPVRALVAQTQPKSRSWKIKDVYDQGERLDNVTRGWDPSACTGFSGAYDLICAPRPAPASLITPKFAFELYRLGQTLDEWAGENYEGSSVLGVAKAITKLGFAGAYHWAFGIDDSLLALSHLGPLVVGTDWQNSMFDPRPSGLITVEGGSSETAGGHAYMFRALYMSKIYQRFLLGKGEPLRGEPLLRGHQSWGRPWGRDGEFLMWASDLDKLLKGISSPGESRITTAAFKRPVTH